MKTFIFTKFGIYIENEEWYRNQLPFFTNICLPSLRAQKDKDFYWIIGIDKRAPNWFKDHLKDLLHPDKDRFLIAEIDLTDDFRQIMSTNDWLYNLALKAINIGDYIDDPEDYIITGAIDLDDAWHRNMIKKVRLHIRQEMRRLKRIEKRRSERNNLISVSQSPGLILTYTNGYWFYLDELTVEEKEFRYHSMSIFSCSKFLSGVTCHAVRHSAWKDFALLPMFAQKELKTKEPYWFYTRNNLGTTQGKRVFGEAKSQENARISLQNNARLLSQYGLTISKLQRAQNHMLSTSWHKDLHLVENFKHNIYGIHQRFLDRYKTGSPFLQKQERLKSKLGMFWALWYKFQS